MLLRPAPSHWGQSVKRMRQVRTRQRGSAVGERALSQRLITLDDQTSHQVRGEGESSQWMEGRADGRSGTPALVRLPLSMPNDELVLTRRTDQRRTERGERTSRHHSTDCPERLSIASCPIRHRRQRGEFLLTIALRGVSWTPSCERLALTREGRENPGIIHCCPAQVSHSLR